VTERNIKLTIQYDGAAYSGWQYQPRLRTVQGELESAIEKLTGRKETLYGAGRTDAGVHAAGQVANFHTQSKLPEKKFRDGLNFHLPDDILIRLAEDVSLDFHARYDAVYRRYEYRLGGKSSVLDRERTWEIAGELALDRLETAAELVLGEHDFSAFCVTASRKPDNRCLVYRSRWFRDGDLWRYEITADRFLHTMIRSLVGLMVELGRGGITLKRYRAIMAGGDHRAVRHVAPAHGLCLVAVGY
jgi:tRNA pseudouridine38-40 synthase